MNLSVATGTASLAARFTSLNGGSLNLYAGNPPATVGTALTGNTLIGSVNFSSPALSGSIVAGGDYVSGVLSFVSSTFTTVTGGTILFGRALDSSGNATLDFGASSQWLPSTAVIVNQMAVNGPNLYICTTAGITGTTGGPTGSGSGIIDGTAVWSFVQPGGSSMTLSNVTVISGLTVTINGTSLGLPITNPVGPALVV